MKNSSIEIFKKAYPNETESWENTNLGRHKCRI